MRDESIKDFIQAFEHGFEPNSMISFHLTSHHVARCQDVLLYVMVVRNGKIFCEVIFRMISNRKLTSHAIIYSD